MRETMTRRIDERHDLWAVNADSAYHEEGVPDEQPYRDAPETPELVALRR